MSDRSTGGGPWPHAGWAERATGGERRPVAVVTGASSGLGLAAAQALVAAGAEVVLACRDAQRGARAAATCGGAGSAVVGDLDLARPGSVDTFAQWFASRYRHLDLLINNAGVMMPPPALTPEGVEVQWATNHLGHFALVGRLLPLLDAAPAARVVAVASLAAESGQVRGYDPTSPSGTGRFATYANSKLANLVFALELERRLRQRGPEGPTSLAAHPGLTHTNLSSNFGGIQARVSLAVSRFTTQPVERGVQPILRAATDPDAAGGDYYGPHGFRQYRGRAVPVPIPPTATDPTLGPDLWATSVTLSGIDYLPES